MMWFQKIQNFNVIVSHQAILCTLIYLACGFKYVSSLEKIFDQAYLIPDIQTTDKCRLLPSSVS